jgi:hypothetical protein
VKPKKSRERKRGPHFGARLAPGAFEAIPDLSLRRETRLYHRCTIASLFPRDRIVMDALQEVERYNGMTV